MSSTDCVRRTTRRSSQTRTSSRAGTTPTAAAGAGARSAPARKRPAGPAGDDRGAHGRRPTDPQRSPARGPAPTTGKREACKAARQRRMEAREAKAATPRKPFPVWVVTTVAFVLPGGGQVLNADPIRGIIMQFFMMLLAFITYMLTSPDISYFGRFAGGFLIYIVSVLDAYSIAKKRSHAWQRLTSEGGRKSMD